MHINRTHNKHAWYQIKNACSNILNIVFSAALEKVTAWGKVDDGSPALQNPYWALTLWGWQHRCRVNKQHIKTISESGGWQVKRLLPIQMRGIHSLPQTTFPMSLWCLLLKRNAVLERSKSWKGTHLQVFQVQKYLFAKDYGSSITNECLSAGCLVSVLSHGVLVIWNILG